MHGRKTSHSGLGASPGWLKLPHGKALTGANHESTDDMEPVPCLQALNVATGQVKAGHYDRRRRREFLDFMNEIVADHPIRKSMCIMDNLSTHKPKGPLD